MCLCFQFTVQHRCSKNHHHVNTFFHPISSCPCKGGKNIKSFAVLVIFTFIVLQNSHTAAKLNIRTVNKFQTRPDMSRHDQKAIRPDNKELNKFFVLFLNDRGQKHPPCYILCSLIIFFFVDVSKQMLYRTHENKTKIKDECTTIRTLQKNSQ